MEQERNPRVSIGLPVYNGADFLEQAIESILRQTFVDFELIICDNASTDSTREICLKYCERDSRIRYHRNSSNIGAAPNFNKVFSLSRGRYFKWAAHDDLLEPGYLQKCVEVLDEDPSVVLCTTEIIIVDSEGRKKSDHNVELNNLMSPIPSDRFKDLVLNWHACIDVFGVLRSECLAKTPLIKSYTGSDRHLLVEIALHGKIYRVPQVLFLSRDHPDRSINFLNLYEREEWFDTKKSSHFTFPYFRQFFEYTFLIKRAPISINYKFKCSAGLFRWTVRNRTSLLGDIKHQIRITIKRVFKVDIHLPRRRQIN
ncbi:MAG: glycosyltransferase family 2 protein [Planctomycetota bacterium]|jgi:glycosyltransferase involved in cell wall biosynthesis